MIINRLIYLIFFSLNIGFVIKKSVFLQPQKGDAVFLPQKALKEFQ